MVAGLVPPLLHRHNREGDRAYGLGLLPPLWGVPSASKRSPAFQNEKTENAMSTFQSNGAPSSDIPVCDSAPDRSMAGTAQSIHFEGDWPDSERHWLRRVTREIDRTLQRARDHQADRRSTLYGVRWLAQRSTFPDGSVRYTIHRQGTSRVLVGESLAQLDRQIRQLAQEGVS